MWLVLVLGLVQALTWTANAAEPATGLDEQGPHRQCHSCSECRNDYSRCRNSNWCRNHCHPELSSLLLKGSLPEVPKLEASSSESSSLDVDETNAGRGFVCHDCDACWYYRDRCRHLSWCDVHCQMGPIDSRDSPAAPPHDNTTGSAQVAIADNDETESHTDCYNCYTCRNYGRCTGSQWCNDHCDELKENDKLTLEVPALNRYRECHTCDECRDWNNWCTNGDYCSKYCNVIPEAATLRCRDCGTCERHPICGRTRWCKNNCRKPDDDKEATKTCYDCETCLFYDGCNNRQWCDTYCKNSKDQPKAQLAAAINLPAERDIDCFDCGSCRNYGRCHGHSWCRGHCNQGDEPPPPVPKRVSVSLHDCEARCEADCSTSCALRRRLTQF